VLFVKGAPEVIMDNCDRQQTVGWTAGAEIQEMNQAALEKAVSDVDVFSRQSRAQAPPG
jgi:magnesium-transporting ATPase (P-type)